MNRLRKQFKRFKGAHPNFYSIIIGVSAVLFVRSVIGFADLFLFPITEYTPEEYIRLLLSYSTSFTIGIFTLYINDFSLKEIE